MTSVLSPLAPSGGHARDALAALLTAAPRAAAPVGKVESARAVRPADPASAAETLRNQVQRERPVGPPPSFEINVLQDIRSRLADPAPEAPAAEAAPPPAAEDSDRHEAEAPDRTDPPTRSVPIGAEAEPPHQLDKKV